MTDLAGHTLIALEDGHPLVTSHIPFSKGLTSEKARELLSVHGKNELEDKKTPKWLILLQQFIAPMPIMIWIAAVVEVAIENYPDFGILLAIQFINAGLGFYEVTKVSSGDYVLNGSDTALYLNVHLAQITILQYTDVNHDKLH